MNMTFSLKNIYVSAFVNWNKGVWLLEHSAAREFLAQEFLK